MTAAPGGYFLLLLFRASRITTVPLRLGSRSAAGTHSVQLASGIGVGLAVAQGRMRVAEERRRKDDVSPRRR